MPTSTYIPLATITLASTDSEIVFSSIPATYRDLIIVAAGTTAADTQVLVRFNSDSGSNYSYVGMEGNGSSASSFSNTGTEIRGLFGSATQHNNILQVMDYSATDKHKTALGRRNIASASVVAIAGRWANTAAVHTVSLIGLTQSWQVGSTFSLYGIEA